MNPRQGFTLTLFGILVNFQVEYCLTERVIMAFVNRYITPEDRARFNLDVSDRWVFNPNPSLGWAIDEESQTFIRLLRLFARRKEFGDPDGLYEKDFHFHWMERDFVVCARTGISPEEYEGRQFGELPSNREGMKIFTFLIREIAEVGDPRWNWHFAEECTSEKFFNDLRNALAEGNAGAFTSAFGKVYDGPRMAILKVAPRARS